MTTLAVFLGTMLGIASGLLVHETEKSIRAREKIAELEAWRDRARYILRLSRCAHCGRSTSRNHETSCACIWHDGEEGFGA